MIPGPAAFLFAICLTCADFIARTTVKPVYIMMFRGPLIQQRRAGFF
jgi:hypothetical protein